ncbi:MAG TPA: FAD-binding oxidoreductase [Longimicrobiaceae bacterium]|nr:FAD-binding oxidoreductase [Longimicrobiaceae bacterium]
MKTGGTDPRGFRGAFLRDDAARAPFGAASGILRTTPDAVAVPEDAADVAALVRWAAETRTPLVARGAGTGMPGGNVGRGVAVDLVAGFRAVEEVDAEGRVARILPGVTLAELNAACAPHALQFPVDPSSGAHATLGGMIANNSAGSHSVKYGAVRPWVESVRVVLADGTPAEATRGREPEEPRLRRILDRVRRELRPHRARIEARWPRVRKNSSGYALREFLESGDAVDLLVGSEGTLALFVGATVRLAPLPVARALALLELTSLERAGEAVREVLRHDPATCEMLDRTFLDLVRSGGADPGYALRPGLEAVLLVEVERGSEAEVEEALAGLRAALEGTADRVVAASDPAEQERLWQLRHAASPLIAERAGGRVSMQFIEDGVVPVERLPDYVRALRGTLERHALPAVIFGHAGDGNLHVNPLVDVAAPGWQRQVEGIVYEIAEAVASLGGTMAGEHGDGRLRAPVLETVWGPEMVALFRRVKEAFDPAGILNPGVILPLPGQRPLDAIGVYPAPG